MKAIRFQIGFFLEPIIHIIYLDETSINFSKQKNQQSKKGFAHKSFNRNNTKSK